MQDGPRLDDLGEAGVLSRIVALLPVGESTLLGPGDDAAVVAAPDGRVVVSTDVLVEGEDFRRDWSTGADVGWKAAAQNLADVAAMGAVPTALVVGLAAPGDLPVSWAENLARGLAAACGPHGVGVVGGDLSAAAQVVVSVTVLGDLEGRSPVRRDGARPGDVVAVAGTLGRSAAGLALLRSGRPGDGADLVATHLRPRPPLAAGPAAALAGATAMIDVSDGLLLDLSRVAAASGVGVDLDPSALAVHVDPLVGPLARLADDGADGGTERGRPEALRAVLTGGEDHALAACFPSGTALPPGFDVVGRVVPASPPGSVLLDGAPPPDGAAGWDHFTPR